MKTRAKFLGIEIVMGDFQEFQFSDDVCGVLIQYPNTEGNIIDYKNFIQTANDAKVHVHVDVLQNYYFNRKCTTCMTLRYMTTCICTCTCMYYKIIIAIENVL